MRKKLTVGDRTTFKALFVDEDSNPIDITNGEITFRYRLNGNTYKEISGSILVAEDGSATATMPIADSIAGVGLFEEGELAYEWHLLDTATNQEWSSEKIFRREVRSRLAA